MTTLWRCLIIVLRCWSDFSYLVCRLLHNMYLNVPNLNALMKSFCVLLFTLYCSVCFAQETKRASSFKAITYNKDGSIWNTRTELIKDTATIYDLYFIAKNFYNLPLPASFSSNEYKSQTIETSTGNNRQTKRVQNLNYDEYGRVISFGQSGCMICSDLGYQYDVHYDVNNQVDTITGATGSFSSSKKYEILYYPNGDVKQIDYFVAGKLSVQITLF